jgi:hypothetical protein
MTKQISYKIDDKEFKLSNKHIESIMHVKGALREFAKRLGYTNQTGEWNNETVGGNMHQANAPPKTTSPKKASHKSTCPVKRRPGENGCEPDAVLEKNKHGFDCCFKKKYIEAHKHNEDPNQDSGDDMGAPKKASTKNTCPVKRRPGENGCEPDAIMRKNQQGFDCCYEKRYIVEKDKAQAKKQERKKQADEKKEARAKELAEARVKKAEARAKELAVAREKKAEARAEERVKKAEAKTQKIGNKKNDKKGVVVVEGAGEKGTNEQQNTHKIGNNKNNKKVVVEGSEEDQDQDEDEDQDPAFKDLKEKFNRVKKLGSYGHHDQNRYKKTTLAEFDDENRNITIKEDMRTDLKHIEEKFAEIVNRQNQKGKKFKTVTSGEDTEGALYEAQESYSNAIDLRIEHYLNKLDGEWGTDEVENKHRYDFLINLRELATHKFSFYIINKEGSITKKKATCVFKRTKDDLEELIKEAVESMPEDMKETFVHKNSMKKQVSNVPWENESIGFYEYNRTEYIPEEDNILKLQHRFKADKHTSTFIDPDSNEFRVAFDRGWNRVHPERTNQNQSARKQWLKRGPTSATYKTTLIEPQQESEDEEEDTERKKIRKRITPTQITKAPNAPIHGAFESHS